MEDGSEPWLASYTDFQEPALHTTNNITDHRKMVS